MNVPRPFDALSPSVLSRTVAHRQSLSYVRLLPYLPLFLLGISVILSLLSRIHLPFSEENPIHQGMARRKAILVAETLCTRIANHSVSETIAQAVSLPVGSSHPTHGEWQILCRIGTDDYFIRLDALGGRLVCLERQLRMPRIRPFAQPQEKIDRINAIRIARRYLIVSGIANAMDTVTVDRLTLQDKGRNVWDGSFSCSNTDGNIQKVRLSLSATNGDLYAIHMIRSEPDSASRLYPSSHTKVQR